MRSLPDMAGGRDRGVTAVVGFILLFGILVITFTVYQAEVVPQQNSQVEFEQYQDVQEQMVELRSNIVLMQESTSTRSTAVDVGVRYPSRTIFVNPGPASGTVRTLGVSDPGVNLTIRNARAVGTEGETADFWDGTALTYNTGAIQHNPDYNQFRGAPPLIYEHSLLHNRIEDGDRSVPVTEQSLVNGNRVSLIALNGTLSESGVGTKSVDLEPTSTRTRVVGVNNTGAPVTIEFASLMGASVWRDTFEDQFVTNGGHVQDVSFLRDGPGRFSVLELTLEPDQRYQFELAKVGVGSGIIPTETTYLTDAEGANTTVEAGSTQRLTVEARDRFNGPQSGVRVDADPEGGTLEENRTNVTDSDGQATFVYEPSNSGTHRINFTIDSGYAPDSSHDPSTPTNVTMVVTVTANNKNSNDNGAFSVDWEDPSASGVTFDSQTGRYNYNASKSGPLELTTLTDPSVDGAHVNYALTNRSRAALSSDSGQTDSDGTHTTRLTARETGNVTVYTSSGGDSDEIRLNITDPGSALTRANSVIYEDKTGGVTVLEGNGGHTTAVGPSNIDAVGPPGAALSSAGTPALPYIEGGSLKLTDTDGNTETLVDGGDPEAPKGDNTVIATGTWQGSDESVFYAGSGSSTLYRVDSGGSPQTVATPGDGVDGVVGTGDIDGDGETELVFVGSSQQVRYINQGGTVDKLDNAGIGSNNALGAGALVQLDGQTWVLLVDGSQDIALVTDDGGNKKEILSSGAKAPPTAADVDTDGSSEIVYVQKNNKLGYIDDPLRTNATTGSLVDSSGANIKVTEQIGVTSP